MRAGLYLIGSYYRRRLVSSVLKLAFLVLFAAATVFMGLMWPTFRYLHTAAALAAQWDVRVNGPLTLEDLGEIRTAAAADLTRLVTANTGSVEVRGPGGIAAVDLHAVDVANPADFAFTLVPSGLVTDGRLDDVSSAGIDQSTLRRIGGRLGETVDYEQTYATADGEPRVVKGKVRLTATVGTTAQFRGLVIAGSPELRRTLLDVVGISATDAFLVARDPIRVRDSISALPQASEWMVITKAEFVQQSVTAAEKAGARSYGTIGLFVTAGLVGVLLLRDVFIRIERRNASLAFAFSLGARARDLVAVHLLEQAVLMLVVSLLGYFVGLWFVLERLDMFPPSTAVRQIAIVWALWSCVLLVVCAAMVTRRMREKHLMSVASFQGGQ